MEPIWILVGQKHYSGAGIEVEARLAINGRGYPQPVSFCIPEGYSIPGELVESFIGIYRAVLNNATESDIVSLARNAGELAKSIGWMPIKEMLEKREDQRRADDEERAAWKAWQEANEDAKEPYWVEYEKHPEKCSCFDCWKRDHK